MPHIPRWLRCLPGVNRLRSIFLARAADQYWSQAFADGGVRTWMAEELCRRSINEAISGSPNEWPMEWFKRVHCQEPFALGLSLGCGEGALERDARQKGICQQIVGIDISEAALSSAQQAAVNDGIDGIDYYRGDFNSLQLAPARYDIVFVHQAMHHVNRLEHCCQQIASTLKDGGLLYLDEYIGPSRTDWCPKLLAEVNTVFTALPASLRLGSSIPAPIEQHDPSEAIRSAEIMAVLEQNFEIVERRDYGGNLLSLILPCLRWESIEPEQRGELLTRLIDQEKALLRSGASSYYTVVIARPRS